MSDKTFLHATDIGKITFDAHEDARAEDRAPGAPRVWGDLSRIEQEWWRFAGVRAAEHVLRILPFHVAGLPIPEDMP